MNKTISERLDALPRARKGATRVVIIEESKLLELIGDAWNKGRDMQAVGLTTITGGAAGGPPMQIHVDPPAGPPPSLLGRVLEDERISRRRRGW